MKSLSISEERQSSFTRWKPLEVRTDSLVLSLATYWFLKVVATFQMAGEFQVVQPWFSAVAVH